MTSLHSYFQPDYPKEQEGGVRCMISEGIYPASEMLTDLLSELTNFGELYFHESKAGEYMDMAGLEGEERVDFKRHLTRYK